MLLLGPVNLKKKYGADWALVTGAGTGIGKSIAETLAIQGLNVVLVSLPDKFLDETTASLETAFPKLKFRKVGAKFDHKTDYMPAIIEVCELHLFITEYKLITDFRQRTISILQLYLTMLVILLRDSSIKQP